MSFRSLRGLLPPGRIERQRREGYRNQSTRLARRNGDRRGVIVGLPSGQVVRETGSPWCSGTPPSHSTRRAADSPRLPESRAHPLR
jgi:hypothetical protein